MSSKKRLVLVVNTGEQDLKRWLKDPATRDTGKPHDRIKGRSLQEWLMKGQVQGAIPGYRVLLPEEAEEHWRRGLVHPVRNDKAVDGLELSCGAPRGRLRDFLRALDRRDNCVVDDALNVLLRPAKIERLVTDLERCIEDESLAVARVLVFATKRISPEEYEQRLKQNGVAGEDLRDRVRGYREGFYAGEPFATGAVIASWLANRLGLTYLGEAPSFDGRCGARWVNIMDGLSQFEGSPGTADHPLHRRLARAIDDALRDAAAGLDGGYALISATGGSNDTKACILASAELRFPGRFRDYPETEEGGRFRCEELDKPKRYIVPTLSLSARAPCATLIRRGDPLGAWGAVAHLAPSESKDPEHSDRLVDSESLDRSQPWLGKVGRLAAFFRGDLTIWEVLSGTEALSDVPGFNRLLQIAFSVEAALEGRPEDRRSSEAVVGIAGFAEQAVYLVLQAAIPARLDTYKLDLYNQRLTDASGGDLGRDARTDVAKTIRGDLRKAGLDQSMHGGLLGTDELFASIDVFGTKARCWRHWLCAQEYETWKRIGESIERYEQFLQTPEGRSNLRAYRNHTAHGSLDAGEARDAERLAGRDRVELMEPPVAGTLAIGPLWSLVPAPLPQLEDGREAFGRRYLASPLVQDIFNDIGDIFGCALAKDPVALYSRMFQDALDALNAPVKLD